jgi:hypothetical protein
MERSKSFTGNSQDQFWRSARDEGYFSYLMKTNSETNLELIVRYWGFDYGPKKFDIYIDDEKIASVDTSDRSDISQFLETTYKIPDSMVKGKDKIRVRFQAQPHSGTSDVYYVRLTKTAN